MSNVDSFSGLSFLIAFRFSKTFAYKNVIRRVWTYQRGNQNPYIEEELKTQWPSEKAQKDKQRSTKHTNKDEHFYLYLIYSLFDKKKIKSLMNRIWFTNCFHYEHTWWRFIQKHVVRTKEDINVFYLKSPKENKKNPIMFNNKILYWYLEMQYCLFVFRCHNQTYMLIWWETDSKVHSLVIPLQIINESLENYARHRVKTVRRFRSILLKSGLNLIDHWF